MRVVSFGGGVQSTALLVLAAKREIDFPTFLFSNVGDNAENPDTLSYVRDVAMPYAKEHGIELHELRKQWRDGRGWTLFDALMNEESRSIDIPVRMSNGSPGNRNCTETFKVNVIAKWMKAHGCTAANKGLMALGISMDEWQRMRTASGVPHYDIAYPLFDLRMDRAQCQLVIQKAGLPVPPKSACVWCPYHSLAQWREMKRLKPEQFQQSIELEQALNRRRAKLGKDDVFLTATLKPLDKALGDGEQPPLFEDEGGCESGFCMT